MLVWILFSATELTTCFESSVALGAWMDLLPELLLSLQTLGWISSWFLTLVVLGRPCRTCCLCRTNCSSTRSNVV